MHQPGLFTAGPLVSVNVRKTTQNSINRGQAKMSMGFLRGSRGKETAYSAEDSEDSVLISGLGRSSGEGNDNPL